MPKNCSTIDRFYQYDSNLDFSTVTYTPSPTISFPVPNYKKYRNRILVTAYYDALVTNQDWEDYDHASHYAYDIHGNVSTLWQEIKHQTLIPADQRIKAMAYKYDLISGKVNEVSYMGYWPDQFKHEYSYDSDNRITEVNTTRNYQDYDRDAAYFYYPHGPLARTEIGENNVQGIDNYYTLQGWMKGVNSFANDPQTDPMHDGLSGTASVFGQDIFSYNLGYFEGDYQAADATLSPDFNFGLSNLPATAGNYAELFNGNITAMATTIKALDINAAVITSPLVSMYRYDRLNRLREAKNELWDFSGPNNSLDISPSFSNSWNSSYSYDLNGNIDTLERLDMAGAPFDKISYTYPQNNPTAGKTISNRLSEVNNSVTAPENYPAQNEFTYDELGNLESESDGSLSMEWTNSGKLKKVTKPGVYELTFTYDAMGNRVTKNRHDIPTGNNNLTYYVRDSQGNNMATYETRESISSNTIQYILKELYLYGSNRLGYITLELEIQNPTSQAPGLPATGSQFFSVSGLKNYELTNHLGNVLSVVSDDAPISQQADLVCSNDYFPFGSQMVERAFNSGVYRYGYQGSEGDNEINGLGNTISTFYREFDLRLNRTWSIDPKSDLVPWQSSYVSMDNNPILYNDPLGDYVDGDTKGMENYRNYRKENNARIESLLEKMKGLNESTKEYKNLNEQMNSYKQINTELDALEQDQRNLYFINSDVKFPNREDATDAETHGMTYFQGMTNYKGKEVKQINIDLKAQMFPLSDLAHEFKHAYQYFAGKLVFVEGTKKGFNSKEIEHEAHERGNRFRGKTIINNKDFNENYKYNSKLLFETYKKLPPTVPSIHGNGIKFYEWHAEKMKVKIIYNKTN